MSLGSAHVNSQSHARNTVQPLAKQMSTEKMPASTDFPTLRLNSIARVKEDEDPNVFG